MDETGVVKQRRRLLPTVTECYFQGTVQYFDGISRGRCLSMVFCGSRVLSMLLNQFSLFLSFIVFRWKINGPMEIQLSVMCLQVRSWNFIYIKKKMTTTASCACKHNYIKPLAAPTYVMQLIFICNWDTALLFMFLYGIFVMLSYY